MELTVPTPAIAAYLVDTIGRDMVAYMTCAELSDVRDWIRGADDPTVSQETKLQAGFDCLTVLAAAHGTETAKGWLFGERASLAGKAPALLIRRLGQHELTAADLQSAAETFHTAS